jgi:sphingolipid delta-4 desaturase
MPILSRGAFLEVSYPEPHLSRTKALLAAHPEAKKLFGPAPISAVLVVLLVALQVAIAAVLSRVPSHAWAWVLIASYAVGAFATHALWVLIHECTHNLIFRSAAANCWMQLLANLPIVFPAAISFRKFHLLHHRYQGDLELDADLPSPVEARLVGNAWWKKALWLLFFWAFQALRVPRLKRVPFFDKWYALNLAIQLTFNVAVVVTLGWTAFFYLFVSSIFAIGLHPVGARWIQEHYLVTPGQETFSYYGPLNVVALNVGYHNEHHDLMRVCWFRLPRLKAMAPEFYQGLHCHRSWTKLLLRFLFDPKLSLHSRAVRRSSSMPEESAYAETAPVPQGFEARAAYPEAS